TPEANNFKLNSLYILSYPHVMNLSRKAAGYYFEMFKQTKNIKQLIIALVIFISPKLAINLKRFM
ncbi:TPA: glycosyltransferase family 2 protein, partial [Mannheimia haemolytica]|nr:glycosyltransferase family 2 protein [Mannheimia haemolytica]